MTNLSALFSEARQKPSGLLLSILNLVFPPRCSGCGRVDFYWCDRCMDELEGLPVILHQRTVFKRLNIVSTGLHEGKLQEAVQALKYDHAEMLKYPLAHRLKAAIEQVNWQPHLISAIPLHKNRQKQRGYNQAELLAQTLSDLAHIPYQADIFQRVQDTRSQVGLTRQERLQNVIAAFHADPQHVKGKRILLVDDVATTGATLTACAQSAIKQGADAVYGLTVTTAQ